jgi:hypothetical protein
MTHDEKREHQKEVIFQAGEAKQQLAVLRGRADRLGRLLARIGQELQTNPVTLLSQSWRAAAAESLTSNRGFYNDQIFREALSFDALMALATEYDSTRQRLEQLNSEKADLGVADF